MRCGAHSVRRAFSPEAGATRCLQAEAAPWTQCVNDNVVEFLETKAIRNVLQLLEGASSNVTRAAAGRLRRLLWYNRGASAACGWAVVTSPPCAQLHRMNLKAALAGG
jgi:hypothetical protein